MRKDDMSPTKTREYREHEDKEARIGAAVEEYAAEKDAAFARVSQRHGLWSVREPSAYGPSSDRSYFLDLVWATGGADQLRGQTPPPIVGNVSEALRRVTSEQRDLTTSATAGGGFVPTGSPAYIGEKFAAAARAAATLATVLPFEPLADTGMVVKTPRVTTGTSTAVMATENSAVSETDVVESMISSPVATVAGQQDLSQQLFDRSDPGMVDVVLATDLGRSLGTSFDQQLLVGTGANGQTFGLKNVVGITSNAYTDATATQQEAFVAVLKLYGDVANALGKAPDRILMRPNRRAWFLNFRDSATGAPAVIPWPCAVTEVPAISNTLGAGTEDELFIVNTSELPVYASPPAFRVHFDPGSGNLIARITAFQYVASLFNRRPEAVGRLSSTGFIAPVFA
jgi:HK97 family phage major capsid protein